MHELTSSLCETKIAFHLEMGVQGWGMSSLFSLEIYA